MSQGRRENGPEPPRPGASGLRIFINYRRSDTADITDRLYDGLAAHFGDDHVFMDIDAIDPGLDFRKVITDAVDACDVCIAVIGKQWLTATDEAGTRRLDDPHDFVRMELRAALERGVRVVPLLVQGVEDMPGSRDLPEGLQDLAWRNAIKLRRESWNHDLARLIEALDRVRGAPRKQPGVSDTSDQESARPPRRIQLSVRFLGIAASVTVVGAAVAIALAAGTGGTGGSAQNTLAARPSTNREATSVQASTTVTAASPSASPSPPQTVGSWPPGVTAYTVVLASDRSRSAAVADADSALRAGLTDVGILRTDDYRSLTPGYWIAFAGQFQDPHQADVARHRARALGFRTAYAKLVRR